MAYNSKILNFKVW